MKFPRLGDWTARRRFGSWALAACAVAATVPIGACSTSTKITPTQDTLATAASDTLRIPLGSSVTSRDGKLRVTYLQLVQESRCPANVTCVWAGDAAVRIRGESSGAESVEATIHTTLDPKRFTAVGYDLLLLDVLPYPGVQPAPPPVVVVLVQPK